MNICEQTKIRMLEGASLSAEEKKHLETCPDCRSLAAFAEKMEQLPALEQDVPAYLDAAVLQAASASVPKPRWRPIIWKVAIPAAAAFALVSGVMFYQSGEAKKLENMGKVVVQKKLPVNKLNIAAEKNASKNVAPVVADESFDDQVIALAIDVGTNLETFAEAIDSVSASMDIII